METHWSTPIQAFNFRKLNAVIEKAKIVFMYIAKSVH